MVSARQTAPAPVLAEERRDASPAVRLPQSGRLGSLVRRGWAVAAYVALIFAVSLVRIPPGRMLTADSDKMLHVLEFGVLAWFLCRFFQLGQLRSRTWVALGALALTVVVGLLNEVLQKFIPHRTCELGDIIANTIGAALVCAGWWLGRSRPSASRPDPAAG